MYLIHLFHISVHVYVYIYYSHFFLFFSRDVIVPELHFSPVSLPSFLSIQSNLLVPAIREMFQITGPY